MTKDQLTRALQLARSGRPLDDSAAHLFMGFGLPNYGPVHCTVEQLAELIRWQCCQFDGGIDAAALNEIATIGRKRFQVIG